MKTTIMIEGKQCGGTQLIKFVDQCVEAFIKENSEKIKMPFHMAVRNRVLTIHNPAMWVGLVDWSRLVITKRKSQLSKYYVPCSIKIGKEMVGSVQCKWNSTSPIPYTERLYDIDERDLTYPAIGEEVQKIYDKNFPDKALVDFMFDGLLCKDMTKKYEKVKLFMRWLVTLMFGVEAGRNKCGLLTNLMLLDMVFAGTIYGKNKKFTLKKLFVSEKGYKWDVGEGAKKYGGKYPMAVHGTPSNSISKRYNVQSKIDVVRNNIHGLNLDEFCRRKDAVLLREVSLIIHWLEAYLGSDINKIDFKRLKDILYNRMRTTYWLNQGRWPLNYNSSRSIDHSKNVGPIQVEGFDETKTENWYIIKGYKRRDGSDVHLFNNCKLIPFIEKKRLINETLEINDLGNILLKDRNGKKICKLCISKADKSNIVYLI